MRTSIKEHATAWLGGCRRMGLVTPSLLVAAVAGGWAVSSTMPTRAVSVERMGSRADAALDSLENVRPRLIGSYRVRGTDPDGKPYVSASILDISLAPSGALELTWDNGKSVGVGQVIGNVLAVASVSNGRTAILLMSINSDGSLSGRLFRRTDRGPRGTETWQKT